jgi:hypothetical protein
MTPHQSRFPSNLVLFAMVLACAAFVTRRAQAQDCSLTGLNGNCTFTIDRLNPVTPSTIYVRHGSQVTVKVISALPFEDLSMDPKKTSVSPPTDQVQSGFSALTQALSGLTITHAPIGSLIANNHARKVDTFMTLWSSTVSFYAT